MGGKGKRRREKNYLEAHGSSTRLPPPPNPKELEALPFKLRKLMELKNPSSTKPGPKQSLKDSGHERRQGGAPGKKKSNSKDFHSSTNCNSKMGDSTVKTTSDKHIQDKDEITHSSSEDRRKRKRKKKEVNDLRFQGLDEEAARLRKKTRRKEYLEARKKKHKKAKKDDILDFPGHEEIKFGEVVEAPPKLSFPKALKTSLDASRERVRLQAIEAYRNRRGWVSRPGIQLPTLPETPSS